jgi:predicted RND superfamily exporter protein
VGRTYIEWLSDLFERIGRWSYDHRLTVLAICLVVLAVFVWLASGARFDNSFENYFDVNDPVYAAYNQYREDFGSDEVSFIVYAAADRPDGVWDLGVMRQIEQLTRALEEEVPFVDEVISLANAEFMEPVDGDLEIYDLLEEFPEDQAALLAVRDKVLKKPLYVGGLASADGRHAGIILEMEASSVDPLDEIRLDPEAGDDIANLYPQVSYRRIEEILARPEYAGIRFFHSGDVPLNAVLNEILAGEAARHGGITFLVIAGVLLFFFRRPVGVVGPLVVVLLSVAVSVGTIGLFGWNLDLMFGMLPNLLIAVGVADAVHIVSEFLRYHVDLGDRREAVRRTLSMVGPACLLTSLTTAAGFAALSIAPIRTLAHFATYAAIGVIAAFLLSVTLLVVFLSFGPRHPKVARIEKTRAEAKGGRRFDRALHAVARFDLRQRKPILAAFAALFVVSIAGMLQLRVDSNFLMDYSEDEPVRRDTFYIDENMSGTFSFVYVFDTGVPDGLKDPAVLRDIERLQAEADRKIEVVTKTYSIVDLLKDINQTFHDGDPAFYRLPETRELVAQYLLVYEMSGGGELDDYISSDYSRATLELRCKWIESSRIQRATAELAKYLQENPVLAAEVSATGIGALWEQLTDYITVSQIRSFLLAFSVIAALMCLVFRSIKTGMLSMAPNLSPVLVTLGAMGWLGIPINYTTMLVAPVAIGIAVDDTMHLLARYQLEFRRLGSYREGLVASMKDVGRALVITSVALVLGFLVMLDASMTSQVNTGLLLAATILLALVANFLLLPALILTFRPFGNEAPATEAP